MEYIYEFTYDAKYDSSEIADDTPRSLRLWEALAGTIIESTRLKGWTADDQNAWSELCLNSTAIKDEMTLFRYNAKHVKMSAMIVKVLLELYPQVLNDLRI